jgi:hypothetical protein
MPVYVLENTHASYAEVSMPVPMLKAFTHKAFRKY